MAQVVVVGGSFAGLSSALFLARRGHSVTVVERDGPPPGASADDDAQAWHRPGAPQAQQAHALLGRARKVLAVHAPDVLEALLARGVCENPVAFGAGLVDDEFALLTRRLVAEASLRRIVEREPRVTVRSGEAVVGLHLSSVGTDATVQGVQLSSGSRVDADLVVDAGGRRSSLPAWFQDAGLRAPIDQTQPCGFFYLTRFFRVRSGLNAPPTKIPNAVSLDYATILALGADNGTFSLTLTLSVNDPFRRVFRDPRHLDAFFRAAPLSSPWMDVGQPIGGVSTMSRIENRRRRLVDHDGAILGGLVAVGDAALHTNPTLGRGISLALWHAQHLAEVADDVASDPMGFVERFESWTNEHLGVWFDTQVAADAAGIERLEAGVRGQRLPVTHDAASQFVVAAFALGRSDPVVGAAVARVAHLLEPPTVAFADAAVTGRVRDFLATSPNLDRPPDVPDRMDFERLGAD